MSKIKHARVQLDTDGNIIKFYRSRDGKACLYSPLESPQASQLAAYHSILNDIKTSLKYFKLLIDAKIILSEEIRKSLLNSAIITYCRCFTDSEGRRSKIEETVYKDRSELLSMHQKLISLRHTYFAHCGNADYEQRKVLAILNPDINKKKVLLIDVSLSCIQNIDKELPKCISLAEFLIIHIKEKIKKLHELVWQDVESINLDDLYNRAVPFDDKYFIYIPIDAIDESYKKYDAILEITEL